MLGDRRPTLEDIRALGFTTRCLNESMRLYPQPPVLIRRALEDDIVGGYRVGCHILDAEGCMCNLCPMHSHFLFAQPIHSPTLHEGQEAVVRRRLQLPPPPCSWRTLP